MSANGRVHCCGSVFGTDSEDRAVAIQDREGRYARYLDMLIGVAMRYCQSNRDCAEELALEALRAAWRSEEESGKGFLWTKSLLLSKLRAVYLARRREVAVSGTG